MMLRLLPAKPLAVGFILLAATAASAQFEPPTVQRGPKLKPVTTFPTPGAYSNTTGIALRAVDGATIHYTLDGTKPTEASPALPKDQPLAIAGLYDGDRGLTTGYTIRAVATQDGHTDSDPETFVYTIARRDRTAYVSEEVAPGVRMIRDSDNDKMFLVRGTKAFALIDTGLGRGKLRDYLAQFTGGLPIIVIATHSHGDHVGQVNQFVVDGPVYIGEADRDAVAQFLGRQGVAADRIAANLKPLADGGRVDLGDRALEIVAVPGHTPGSIAILDPATGNLFTGDTFGNNSPLPPDVMWLQGYQNSIDVYLANVKQARARLDGRVRRIMTGHNDRPLEGTAFLDNLETAMQRGLDRGEAALVPSWRPLGIVQLVQGDVLSDPNWFGANVNRARFLPAPPDQIAGLTALVPSRGTLTPRFSPAVHDYVLAAPGAGPLTLAATPTSTRSKVLTVGGRAARPGGAVPVRPGATPTEIVVTAPDGATRATYRVRVSTGRPN